MIIRLAELTDAAAIAKIDRHVQEEMLTNCINNQQIIVAIVADKIIGLIRYNLFWDLIPFMNLIEIVEVERNKGHGTELLAFYEMHIKKLGYRKCLTSTMSNEEAQNFYRKTGIGISADSYCLASHWK